MTSASEGWSWIKLLASTENRQKLQQSKILCVGAGGIGCELIKTLVLADLVNIDLIDLDTIETSNLNRQFLFRKHHVGQSKARVAADVIAAFASKANIAAHQADVTSNEFDLDFFKKFDIVLNGLDNLEARRHVNRLCIAAERPLIESGTTGYIGQVTVHVKGVTECFECLPKPTPKSYPVCTLRNTPSKPVHCIVWAKDMLFTRLFGGPEAVTDLDEESGIAIASHANTLKGRNIVAKEGLPNQTSAFIRQPDEDAFYYALRIYDRVFVKDIERVKGMEIWSLEDNCKVFLASIVKFHMPPLPVLVMSFDKDDDWAVDFVTSAANLRSLCYSIPLQTCFQAKGMAGNIIHAIATTNAVIAGLIVTEAIKILAGVPKQCRNSYLSEKAKESRAKGILKRRLVTVQVPSQPAANCMVCGKSQLYLRMNLAHSCLSDLLNKVIKKELAVTQPTLFSSGFMYEEGDGLDEDEVEFYQKMLSKSLNDVPGGGLRHGSVVTVNDHLQNFSVNVQLIHQEAFDEDIHPEKYILSSTSNSDSSISKTRNEAGLAEALSRPMENEERKSESGKRYVIIDEETNERKRQRPGDEITEKAYLDVV